MRTDLCAICRLFSGPGPEGSSVIWHRSSENGTSPCAEAPARLKEERGPCSGQAALGIRDTGFLPRRSLLTVISRDFVLHDGLKCVYGGIPFAPFPGPSLNSKVLF